MRLEQNIEEKKREITMEKEQLINLLKTEAGREKLAQEYVNQLETDDTQPVPDRDAWIGEKHLRDLESVALSNRLFGEFAKFSEKAGTLATEPTIKILFDENRINGLRRLPEGEREDDTIGELFKETNKSIESLEDSPRKNRLLSLWSYHAGIYARVIGDFQLAAESQARSAELAEQAGDMKSAVISRFCEVFERVNHALVSDLGKISEELEQERKVGKFFYETLSKEKDPTSVRWNLLSGPNHLLLTHFWANAPYDGKSDVGRFDELKSFDPEMAEKFKGSISIAQAVQFWNEGKTNEARLTAQNYIQTGEATSPEFLATAHLLLGRIAAAEDRKEEAKEHLQDTIAIQGSAHQVRAVARRELEALNVWKISVLTNKWEFVSI